MNNPVPEQLALLLTLDRTGLNKFWKDLVPEGHALNLRKDLMVPIISYRLQERTFGGLKPETKRQLRNLVRIFEKNPNAKDLNNPDIKPGTQLVRKWKNSVHVVDVVDNGYEYDGARYRSLSEIARLITGTRWSGPLFFGLKSNRSKVAMR